MAAGSSRGQRPQDPLEIGQAFADAQAADGVAVEIHGGQFAQRPLAQVLVQAALDDGELQIAAVGRRETLAGPGRPGAGQPQRLLVLGAAGRVGREMVQDHLDVGIQHVLDIDHVLGGEDERASRPGAT